MSYVVVYVDDDMNPSAYGTATGRPFASHEAASRVHKRMDADLEECRDEAGGGAGHVAVLPVQRLGSWQRPAAGGPDAARADPGLHAAAQGRPADTAGDPEAARGPQGVAAGREAAAGPGVGV